MKHLVSVFALFASFAILCLGHGLQSVLIPARAALEEYSNLFTGVMMSAYYIGFLAGTKTSPWMIARVGHIRVFAASTACAASIMLAHALAPSPSLWLLLRFLYGFCLLHLYTVMESWLNSIGDHATRGKVLSVYMILNFLAMSGGQMLFFLAPAKGFELFSISAMMLCLSLVPLILSRISQPVTLPTPAPFGLKELYRLSPLGIAGALIAGLMGGAYWGLTALYLLRVGFTQDHVAWFMAASLVGGLIAQWPLGHVSDKINRRYVILLVSTIVCATSLPLALFALGDHSGLSVSALIFLGILFGAGFHPLYSLCIAHANDFVAPEHFVKASAGLQFVQSFGAIAGPLLAGVLMYTIGRVMLFLYIAALAGALAIYTLLRLIENRTPSTSSPFRFLTRMGLFALMMDPRYRRSRTRS